MILGAGCYWPKKYHVKFGKHACGEFTNEVAVYQTMDGLNFSPSWCVCETVRPGSFQTWTHDRIAQHRQTYSEKLLKRHAGSISNIHFVQYVFHSLTLLLVMICVISREASKICEMHCFELNGLMLVGYCIYSNQPSSLVEWLKRLHYKAEGRGFESNPIQACVFQKHSGEHTEHSVFVIHVQWGKTKKTQKTKTKNNCCQV